MTRGGKEFVDRLRLLYDRLAEGDFSADIEIYDPNIEVVWAEGMADSTIDRGLEALGATINGFMEAFRDVRFVAEQFVAKDDQVLVFVEGRGTGRATELPVSRKAFHLSEG
jgi:ketosteroid isomerase-like protein